ncbi:MAG: tRNA (N(6)-L-threonylcarbamoyladenosine(37)-C(2))-methylthiotransferase MtaB [Fidelibacterota bacterium]|nr:MAG: tRNA (N(6)-L-threonylcarbamoyladenosine(37)-C(2))-methylthiotransferase MtaB [Candidatus Neomarinimicrobiota bacterium]
MTIAKDTPAIRQVSFNTLGCKLNQAETDAIATLFRRRGWQVVPFRQESDLTVINTCTVTGEADAKSRQAIRQAIRRAARTSPQGKVVVAGCYSQIRPEEAASFEGVDLVLGTREKWRILDLLEQIEGNGPDLPLIHVGNIGVAETYDEAPLVSAPIPSGCRTGRTRAFLKVQEGCDYHCSYCIVPAARGLGRSRPLESCLEEVCRLVAEGYREVVLTGVNIGTWQEKGLRFNDLLAAMSRVDGLRRIRVSSIEPNLLTDEIIRLVAERENIAPHFHVPLQHASDRVLKAMRRRYCIADYRAVLERIVTAIPDAAIGADVMVGFPGETEKDFRQLAGTLTDLPLTYHHIFRYSERSSTAASHIIGAVDPVVRKERSAVLREISRQRRRQVARRSIGQTRQVHFERPDGNGSWEGLTDNYLRVKVPVPMALDDPFQPVQLTGYGNSALLGRLSRPAGIPEGAS